MKFGETPLDQAEGVVLAHSVRSDGLVFKKGRVLSADDVEALGQAGITSVIAASLEADDVAENEAAVRIAEAVGGVGIDAETPFTGRVNLLATRDGVLILDHAGIDRLNRVDEGITIATLPPMTAMRAGQMAATVKIIPFAVPRPKLDEALSIAADDEPLVELKAFQPLDVALVQTRLPGIKETVLDKTVGVTAERLRNLGGRLVSERRCPHDVPALASRLTDITGDLILIAGASAITDRRDVLPQAIEAAGGRIDHLGMPVDPGNLLLLGRLGERPVLGLPGCARSPKSNGFDWVLQRLFAGLKVTSGDIMGMGIGGLLSEIPSRPQPRDRRARAEGGVAAILLAAGQSTRMGRDNKLLAGVDGQAMVLHGIDAMLASKADPVIVVIGHEAEAVREVIGSRAVDVVRNEDYPSGLSSSLRRGLDALPAEASGVLIGLGDMPRIKAADIDRLIAAFSPLEGRSICVPTVNGKRGNPVLFSIDYVEEMRAVEGDVGARHLIGAHAEHVCEIEMDDEAALLDIDTKEALAELTRR
ncbi:MAG: NTP transferase domain-containing protein [Geminicoccaceae bacterium]